MGASGNENGQTNVQRKTIRCATTAKTNTTNVISAKLQHNDDSAKVEGKRARLCCKAVHNENIHKDDGSSTQANTKASLHATRHARALKVQKSSESVTTECNSQRASKPQANPLKTQPVNSHKRTFTGVNVPNLSKPAISRANTFNASGNAKVLKQRKASATKSRPENTYMSDLARQYDELCAMEAEKLQTLEAIISKRQQVDVELAKLTCGRPGAK